MAGRNYTHQTIKTLFGRAHTCAFPGCGAPLIFTDPTRGGDTVVAEIAHIRSESAIGPRHDPSFLGNIDGPENLLLLCGVHHKPVDRHEVLYTTDELLAWKALQLSSAGSGIVLSDEDVIRFTGFSAEERAAITAMAKWCSKVERLTTRALEKLAHLEHEKRMELIVQQDTRGLHSLTGGERQLFDAELGSAWRDSQVRIVATLDHLAGEVAVLEMMSPVLGPAARAVLAACEAAATTRGDPGGDARFIPTHGALRELWLVVNPD